METGDDRQRRIELLAEETGHVGASGSQAVIHRARNEHLHHRLPGVAALTRIEVGLFHVGERRRHDDAGTGAAVRVILGSCREPRQLLAPTAVLE